MSNKIEDLDRLIRATVVKLKKARDDVTKLEGEYKAMTQVRALMFPDADPLVTDAEPAEPARREISPEWREILGFFTKRSPKPVSIDEVMDFIESRNFSITRNAVRSQLHIYMNRGYLERIGDGHYRATDAVKSRC